MDPIHVILQETALHLAVKYQCEDIVKWLLQELTAEINATDHVSWIFHLKFFQPPEVSLFHCLNCL